MSEFAFVLIYFSYGLAFFSMGLVVMLEGGRASDERLRRGLRPLAAFGLVHALHEWIEMLGPLARYSDVFLPFPQRFWQLPAGAWRNGNADFFTGAGRAGHVLGLWVVQYSRRLST